MKQTRETFENSKLEEEKIYEENDERRQVNSIWYT